MEHIKEDQILLYEELCSKDFDRDEQVNKATIRFRENIKLAYHVAKRYYPAVRDPSMDVEDINQLAFEGLWKACLSFDESKGYEFSTYAVPYIRGIILRGLRETNPIHTPRWFLDVRAAVYRHGFTTPLSDEEIDIIIAENPRLSREHVLSYEEPVILELDRPIDSSDDNIALVDILSEDTSKEYEDYLSEDELEEAINDLLKYIPIKDRDLIEEWFYSILADDELTQAELAKKYHKSQPNVSRIRCKARTILKMHDSKLYKILGLGD